MAFKQANKNERSERRVLDMAMFPDWKLTNVRAVTETMATFTLNLCDGLALYGVKCIYSQGKGYFVVSAQTPYTAKDGTKKYANNYGLYLSEEFEKEVIDCVRAELES